MTRALAKILLVDDDEVTNLMHQRRISRSGLARKTEVATDGQAAMDRLLDCMARKEDPPDLVLLDINMPRMNGFEFLDAFKTLPTEFRERQRIVVVSTSNLNQDRVRIEKDGGVLGYETKPLSERDFERIIGQVDMS